MCIQLNLHLGACKNMYKKVIKNKIWQVKFKWTILNGNASRGEIRYLNQAKLKTTDQSPQG